MGAKKQNLQIKEDTVLDVDLLKKIYKASETKDGVITLDLSLFEEAEVEAINELKNIAGELDLKKISGELVVTHPRLKVQLDFERMHRRFKTRYEGEEFKSYYDLFVNEEGDEIFEIDEFVLDWRKSPNDVVAMLSDEDPITSSFLLKWIVHNEELLYSHNKIAPYQDLIPKLIVSFDPEKLSSILNHLDPGLIVRVLLFDYTHVNTKTLAEIIAQLSLDKVGKVLDYMVEGADFPRRVVPVLRDIERDKLEEILDQCRVVSLLKALSVADKVDEAVYVIKSLSQNKMYELIYHLTHDDTDTDMKKCAASILDKTTQAIQEFVLNKVSESNKQQLLRDKSSKLDLEKLKWECSDNESHLFVSGEGLRTTKKSEFGKVVEIDEFIDCSFGRKRVQVHMIELDQNKFDFSCFMPSDKRYEFDDFEKELRPYYSKQQSPKEEVFRGLGLFRLADATKKEGASVGINGNFYFDYGHYAYGQELNIDFSKSPGLKFGDPVGLFVSNYKVLSPGIFNRAAFVVNEEGKTFIERIKICGVEFKDDVEVLWSSENRVTEDKSEIRYFSSLYGFSSPLQEEYVDVVISGSVITEIKKGGGACLPLTGFIVSLPENSSVLKKLTVGDSVEYIHNFKHGKIKEAMGCGPLLLNNGNIDVDFNLEEFGRKDSSVMSFFLPRLFESYEAARSFIALRSDGTLVFGTISGRSFGTGPNKNSCGMTFGEMAYLVKDLGFVQAMGLDGGGSSSLVLNHMEKNEVEILNVPTGGTDVPRGSERFISTGLLAFKK